MQILRISPSNGFAHMLRVAFRPREFFFHDGSTMRRIAISVHGQLMAAGLALTMIILSLFGTAQLAGAATLISTLSPRAGAVLAMQARVTAMQSDMAAIKQEAATHAARLEAKQAFLDAVLTGKTPTAIPANATSISPAAAALIAPLAAVETQQSALAGRALALVDARYRAAAATLGKVGIAPDRVEGGMGGPYEPVSAASLNSQGDPAFRALFQSWKRLDQLQQGIVAIPSSKPVDVVTFTSGFGVRTDPFRGGAAMHAGVDIPGAMGTSIYATADGVVSRGEWANGYGNLVEIDHGRGIQTRYGHLSAILVHAGQRVTRGQLIARMGSTGRSTGTHLHYEVRLDGHAVNPMPFLASSSYLAAMALRTPRSVQIAQGGPDQ